MILRPILRPVLRSPLRSVFDGGVGGGDGYNPASEFSGGALGALYPVWDISTLSQDRAGTVPVTADGDPVRHMLDTSGNGNHWLPATDAGFGTYTLVDGKPCVRIPAAGFFATAKNKTLQLPMYYVCAVGLRNVSAVNYFGVTTDNSNRFGAVPSSPDRVSSYLRTTAAGISQALSDNGAAPLLAPVVIGSLAVPGTTDVSVGGVIMSTAANSLTVDSSVANVAYVLASTTGAAANAAELDFYGGMILHAAPINRAGLEDFFKTKVTVPPASTDFNVLVIGDSTGDELDEWVRSFANVLAADSPTAEVSYRAWEDSRNRYGPVIQVQAGSAPAIRIFNASVAGSQPIHHMGANFDAALGNVPYDVVMWNYGNNLISGTNDAAGISVYGKFSASMDQFRQAFPGVPQLVLRPSPRRDDDLVGPVVNGLDFILSQYDDTTIADVYGAFIALGKASNLYEADGVHPTALGTQVFVDEVSAAWTAGVSPSGPAFLETKVANLLANGDFAAFAGEVPDGWTLSGNGSVAKDEANTDGGPWAVKISSNTTSTELTQTIDATPYRGGNVTLLVRQFLEAGGSNNSGQIYLETNGTGGRFVRNQSEAKGTGGWRWTAATIDVPADTTTITAGVTASVTGAGVAYYDRAILVPGSLPRDMA